MSLLFQVTFICCLAFILIFTASYSFIVYRLSQEGIDVQKAFVTENTKNANTFIRTFYAQAEIDIRSLASTAQVKNFIENHRKKTLTNDLIEDIQQLFVDVISIHEKFKEIRLIEVRNKGKELIRVDNYNQLRVVPESQLQEKKDRDYFKKALSNPPGKLYVGEVTLRRESYFRGPDLHSPQVRLLLPFYFENEIQYFLVFNLDYSIMTKHLTNLFGRHYHILLYNKNGHYTFSSDPNKKNLFTFEYNKQAPLSSEFPQIKPHNDLHIIKREESYFAHQYFNNFKVGPDYGIIIGFKSKAEILSTIELFEGVFVIFGLTLVLMPFPLILLTRKILTPLIYLKNDLIRSSPSIRQPIEKKQPGNEVKFLTEAIGSYINEIKQKETFLSKIFDNSQDGLCLIDSKGKILMANGTLERMFDYEPGELKEKQIEVLMYEGHSRDHQTFIETYFSNGTKNALTEGRELIAKKKTNREIPIFLVVARIEVSSSSRCNFLGIVRDLSQVKKIESSLIKEKEISLIESKYATIGKTISGIAHEINSPLQNIVLTLEYLETLLKSDNKDVNDELIALKEEAHRISNIIQAMKSLGIANGQNERNYVQVNSIIQKLNSVFGQELKLNHIESELNLDATLGISVLLDSSELQQILLNLVNNSIYSLSQTCPKSPRIYISTKIENGQLIISITDNGQGVDPNIVKNLFTPLQTTKKVGEGTGLGLSISKSLAKKNNGNLSLTSNTPFQAITFEVSFKDWRKGES